MELAITAVSPHVQEDAAGEGAEPKDAALPRSVQSGESTPTLDAVSDSGSTLTRNQTHHVITTPDQSAGEAQPASGVSDSPDTRPSPPIMTSGC